MSLSPLTKKAPVALFVYNRPYHTKRTLDALEKNFLALETPLYIFIDAPSSNLACSQCNAVLKCVSSVRGFASVRLLHRENHIGLANSIIDGVQMLCAIYGRVIVLEDDLETSPHFLHYMNDALDLYANDESVGSISAYLYPVRLPRELPDTIMLRFPMSWGWGTWARCWNLFERDGTKLRDLLKTRRMTGSFNSIGIGNSMSMLNNQIAGRNDSWFIRWHASLFLAKKKSLAPSRSLINNIGLDGTGVHCSKWHLNPYAVQISTKRPLVTKVLHDSIDKVERSIRRFGLKVKYLRYVNAAYRLVARLLRL